MLHSTGHLQRAQLKTELQNINNCHIGYITLYWEHYCKKNCEFLGFHWRLMLTLFFFFYQNIKHYLPCLYLWGGRYTFSLFVNVSNDCRMSDLNLGNVFWPRSQTYDSTISRLSARFENSDSTMKILSRGHPQYFLIITFMQQGHINFIRGDSEDIYNVTKVYILIKCSIDLYIHQRILKKQQISILEWFLKNHVTLKTGVMMLKIQLCITGINNILKYNKKKLISIIIFHNNTVFTVF